MVISDVWKHYKSSAKTLNFISAIEHVKVSGKPIIKLKSAFYLIHIIGGLFGKECICAYLIL